MSLIPDLVYVLILLILCIGAIIVIFQDGFYRRLKNMVCLFLVEYIFLIYGITNFFREPTIQRAYNFVPFWSYQGKSFSAELFLPETIVNIGMFIPIGLLIRVVYKPMRWWMVMLIGGGISILIETIQFIFKYGFSEFDDVFHNTLGCLIGYVLFLIFHRAWLMVLDFRQTKPKVKINNI